MSTHDFFSRLDQAGADHPVVDCNVSKAEKVARLKSLTRTAPMVLNTDNEWLDFLVEIGGSTLYFERRQLSLFGFEGTTSESLVDSEYPLITEDGYIDFAALCVDRGAGFGGDRYFDIAFRFAVDGCRPEGVYKLESQRVSGFAESFAEWSDKMVIAAEGWGSYGW